MRYWKTMAVVSVMLLAAGLYKYWKQLGKNYREMIE
jgi:hypothetical protein